MMMGVGGGILVLEMADYVLTGSRSKLRAVVTLSEGLGKREGGRGRDIELLLIDADCRVGDGKQGFDSCQSTLDSPWR